MECRFLDLKFGADKEMGVTGGSASSQFSGFKQLVGGSGKVASPHCREVVGKASCSSLSSNVNGSAGFRSIEAETVSLYRIDEKNGANFSLFPRYGRVLEAVDDAYEGVVIDSQGLPESAVTFVASLRTSLSHWRTKGKKGVWLKLPKERSGFVPIAVKEGFEYHHAEKGYLMLTYWIPEGPCMLPANASHQVGVGGFVINDRNEVLVVQEKYCSPQFRDCWKLPTGFIHESEEIYAGAVREVKEETGIDTEFVEVIAFRHAHNVAFEKSDLFFICMLRPLSTEINVDDQEIQAAKWMALDEFVQQAIIRSDNMFNKIIGICVATMNRHYCGLAAQTVVSKFDGKSSSLYYNTTQVGHNCVTNTK
uniref:Nudix hydrolase domain-containing protein n=1 Tax=Kalanchoe fedtschenkoi TaxID=63787 RepID=A0A7N1A9Q3_KALFE